jgi:site-specific DNA-cytosine methylase
MLHQDYCSVEDTPEDLFVAGTPCQPYSTQRSKRKTCGTDSHPQRSMVNDFVDHLLFRQPRLAVFEQVTGFAQPESVANPETPLNMFLQVVNERLPQYSYRVYCLDSNAWLPASRPRTLLTDSWRHTLRSSEQV